MGTLEGRRFEGEIMANRESSHDRRPQNEDSATNHSEDFRYEEPEELEYEEYDEYDDYEE
jgi:hypothetical protein